MIELSAHDSARRNGKTDVWSGGRPTTACAHARRRYRTTARIISDRHYLDGARSSTVDGELIEIRRERGVMPVVYGILPAAPDEKFVTRAPTTIQIRGHVRDRRGGLNKDKRVARMSSKRSKLIDHISSARDDDHERKNDPLGTRCARAFASVYAAQEQEHLLNRSGHSAETCSTPLKSIHHV